MNELALFAGAGGGILGGKLLGWRTVCAVERDAYAAQVLAQRQNDGTFEPFPIWSDVRSFDGYPWRGIVDVISGGFPCQDISSAGKGCGLDGERSGLWREMARIIGEVRPKHVFVENSPLLTSRGGDRVVGDLTAMGYDCQWGVIGAHNAGAPHKRDRIWIVAKRVSEEHENFRAIRKSIRRHRIRIGEINPKIFLHSKSERCREARECISRSAQRDSRAGDKFSNSTEFRLQSEANIQKMEGSGAAEFFACESRGHEFISYSFGTRLEGGDESGSSFEKNDEFITRCKPARALATYWRKWPPEPELGRVAHGVANRIHRIKAIGNGQVGRMVPLAWGLLA